MTHAANGVQEDGGATDQDSEPTELPEDVTVFKLPCQEDADCKVLVAGLGGCMVAECKQFVCETKKLEAGSPCDDGDPCTPNTVCAGGICYGPKIMCNDDNNCTDDQCTQTGCVYAFNASPCNDNSACTLSDACAGGACAGGTVLDCNDQSPCTVDACDPKIGCTHEDQPGGACSDDNPCTIGDSCKDQQCAAGKVKNCDDLVPCTDDSCDKQSGKCNHAANVAPCDDGNDCTEADTCAGGVCAGAAADCNDKNPCTTDSCLPNGGCQHIANSLPCDDSNACTESDVCTKTGICKGNAVVLAVYCDDSNACTTDTCNALTGCQHSNNQQVCDDGNPCTSGDACEAGACKSGASTCKCTSDADCATSEDGDLCNGTLFCDKSSAVWACKVNPATVVNCDAAADTECTENSCAPKVGKCAYVHKNEGKPCDADGTVCTAGDVCASGKCLVGKAVACDDGNPCTADACNAKDGCTAAATTQPCSDGNACTQGDACKGGACVAGPIVQCDDGNACTSDACDPASGGCKYANTAAPCDDGNACTLSDGCKDAVCSGAPAQCNDSNPCTTDSCNPKTGCANTANTSPCDDGNACSTGDLCAGGACKGIAQDPKALCDDGNPCTTETCTATDGCLYNLSSAGCDDGNPCTTGDQCKNGQCTSGTNTCGCAQDSDCAAQEDGNLCNGTLFCDKTALPYKCNVNPKTVVACDGSADTVCSKNTCDTKTGTCGYLAQNAGKPCDADGSVCTSGDLCSGLNCQPGAPQNCNDGNPCTDDSCDPKTGCVFKQNSVPCSDGNACTIGDVCKNAACVPGPAQVCNDNNPCTSDSCASGSCTFAHNALGCDDGNACSGSDACSAGVCKGVAVNCNDNNPCTNDACDPKAGCQNAANTIACNDGNACTSGDVCGGGACKGTAVSPAQLCDDGNPCTTEGCDPKTGCTKANNSASCDDGNPCTSGDVCAAGACKAGTNTCGCAADTDCASQEDGNLCNGTLFCDKSALPYKCNVNPKTVVQCDTSADSFCSKNACDTKAGKCGYQPANEAKPCDADGSVCTGGDACAGGVCKAGAAQTCNDNNPCTTDSCTTSTGQCAYAPNTLPCDDGNACSQNDACASGTCKGTALNCNDNNVCTNDSCDPTKGCINSANTVSCNDSNACTTSRRQHRAFQVNQSLCRGRASIAPGIRAARPCLSSVAGMYGRCPSAASHAPVGLLRPSKPRWVVSRGAAPIASS
ncbi:MAG: hypothetical protein FJ100_19245, partial [Deltaproteobacteria bacterium]|nr:hypothetical protein [Deltaproteobacteria bacterium]